MKSAHWCHCQVWSGQTEVCPGPVKLEPNGRTVSCQNCGTKYLKGAKACQTLLCAQCHGKRL